MAPEQLKKVLASPARAPARAVTSLNLLPGAYCEVARSRRGSVALMIAFIDRLFPLRKAPGSREGAEAMARMSPLLTSSITAAPRPTPGHLEELSLVVASGHQWSGKHRHCGRRRARRHLFESRPRSGHSHTSPSPKPTIHQLSDARHARGAGLRKRMPSFRTLRKGGDARRPRTPASMRV